VYELVMFCRKLLLTSVISNDVCLTFEFSSAYKTDKWLTNYY